MTAYSTKGKKDEVRPRRGHEGPEGDYRYSVTLPLTPALDGGIGGWVVPSAGLDGCENLASTRIRSPCPPAHSESLGLTVIIIIIIIIIINV